MAVPAAGDQAEKRRFQILVGQIVGSDMPAQDSAGVSSGWVWAAVSAAVLLAAIVFAAVYRKQN